MRISWLMVFWLTIIGMGLEFYLSIQVALWLGWWTLAWIIGAAGLGYFLITEEKVEFMFRVVDALRERRSLWSAVADSGRTLIAGILFIIPGIVSDILALIIWFFPLDFIFNTQTNSTESASSAPENAPEAERSPHSNQNRQNGSLPHPVIIEGEFKREDERR